MCVNVCACTYSSLVSFDWFTLYMESTKEETKKIPCDRYVFGCLCTMSTANATDEKYRANRQPRRMMRKKYTTKLTPSHDTWVTVTHSENSLVHFRPFGKPKWLLPRRLGNMQLCLATASQSWSVSRNVSKISKRVCHCGIRNDSLFRVPNEVKPPLNASRPKVNNFQWMLSVHTNASSLYFAVWTSLSIFFNFVLWFVESIDVCTI